jgi:hypothetical protein
MRRLNAKSASLQNNAVWSVVNIIFKFPSCTTTGHSSFCCWLCAPSSESGPGHRIVYF